MPSIGPNTWGTCADDSGVGTVAWTGTGAFPGGPPAVSLNSGQVSHYLDLTQFGFSLGAGNTIVGVLVQITNAITNGTVGGETSSIKLVVGGVVSGSDLSDSALWNGSNLSYGGSSNLWGLSSLSVSQITASNFGVAISTIKTGGGSGECTFSNVQITVYYVPTTDAREPIRVVGSDLFDLQVYSEVYPIVMLQAPPPPGTAKGPIFQPMVWRAVRPIVLGGMPAPHPTPFQAPRGVFPDLATQPQHDGFSSVIGGQPRHPPFTQPLWVHSVLPDLADQTQHDGLTRVMGVQPKHQQEFVPQFQVHVTLPDIATQTQHDGSSSILWAQPFHAAPQNPPPPMVLKRDPEHDYSDGYSLAMRGQPRHPMPLLPPVTALGDTTYTDGSGLIIPATIIPVIFHKWAPNTTLTCPETIYNDAVVPNPVLVGATHVQPIRPAPVTFGLGDQYNEDGLVAPVSKGRAFVQQHNPFTLNMVMGDQTSADPKVIQVAGMHPLLVLHVFAPRPITVLGDETWTPPWGFQVQIVVPQSTSAQSICLVAKAHMPDSYVSRVHTTDDLVARVPPKC